MKITRLIPMFATLSLLMAASCSNNDSEQSNVDSKAFLLTDEVNCLATGESGSQYNRLNTEGNENAQFYALITDGSDFCKFADGSVEFTGKVGNSVYFRLDANESKNERHVSVRVEFDDNSLNTTLQFIQLGYSASASYDKHAWAELPVHVDDASYIYKTYYTSLATSVSKVRNYTICYDAKKHVSHWVAYPVHDCYIGGSGRAGEFCFDPNDQLPYISESIQQNVAAGGYNDGANRGLDRGHMIPSASRTVNSATNIMTFYATNMMPQASSFNQNSWADLEGAVRDCKQSGSYAALADTVYVVTGTHFADGYQTIKSRGVDIAVPTHAWKVLLRAKSRNRDDSDISKLPADQLISIGFIYENSTSSRNTSFSAAACSVEEIEKLTGFKFWNMLPEDVAVEVKSRFSLNDWGNAFK